MRVPFLVMIASTLLAPAAAQAENAPGERTGKLRDWDMRVSLCDLMTSADLVLVGAVPDFGSTRGELHIRSVDVHRLIASVSSFEDVGLCMSAGKDKPARILVVKRPPPRDDRLDPSLMPGGRFLFWLKRMELTAKETALVGVDPRSCYELVDGWKGAIIVSEPKDLAGYDRMLAHLKNIGLDPKKDYPYASHDALLQNSFGTSDRRVLLIATQTFAWLMAAEGPLSHPLLEEFAKRKDPIWSATAAQLLRQKNTRRFQCISLSGLAPM